MNSYTVIQPPWVDDQLAELWMESEDHLYDGVRLAL
jgi:hypothetical protein